MDNKKTEEINKESLDEVIKKSVLTPSAKNDKEISKLVDDLINLMNQAKEKGLFKEKTLVEIIRDEFPKPVLFYDALNACLEYSDYTKAFEMFDEEYQNNPNTPLNMSLGDMYYYGIGTKQDYFLAMKYYQKAIENHDTEASFAKALSSGYYSRGRDYLRGIGCDKDIQKAIRNFELSLKYGRIDAGLALGSMYYCGDHVDKDYEKALEYWKEAAMQGSLDQNYRPTFDKVNTAIAFNNLGYMYNKLGCKNGMSPLAYFKKAASLDLAEGYTNVGRCYDLGVGTEIDEDEAIKWYQLGYDLGSKSAKKELEKKGVLPIQKK